MNQGSAFDNVMMMKLLSGAVRMKHKEDCLKKTSGFSKSFKGPRNMTNNILTISVHVHFEILDNFLIPTIEI